MPRVEIDLCPTHGSPVSHWFPMTELPVAEIELLGCMERSIVLGRK